jgi:hypothetical protein
MNRKVMLFAVALALGPSLGLLPAAAHAACEFGERTNASTSDWARKQFEQAGYRQLRDFKKGCDSVWHAVGSKAGAQVRVMVSPQGQVLEEKD